MKTGLLWQWRSWRTQPAYRARPSLMIRRLSVALKNRRGRLPELCRLRLPWGVWVTVDRREHIGESILVDGLYEPVVCEAVWRLLEPGDVAADVGANLGQMSSLMAVRGGSSGKVVSFEPHPLVASRLRENAEGWSEGEGVGDPDVAEVTVVEAGVSASEGEGFLLVPHDFGRNQGNARLESAAAQDKAMSERRAVRLVTLDTELPRVLGPQYRLGLMKLDVEGHEASALRGAEQTLKQKRVKHIIFEQFGQHPAEASSYLEALGYALFRVLETPDGVAVDRDLSAETESGEPPVLLATVDPTGVTEAFSEPGWRCLVKRGGSLAGIRAARSDRRDA